MPSREALPRFIDPMLLTTGHEPTNAAGWALEVKWDGWRTQARVGGGVLDVRTRHGRLITAQFPELASLAAAVPASVILDAELVCLDAGGMPDFFLMRGRGQKQRAETIAAAAATAPAKFMIFDLLHLDGHSTRGLPYRRRRELLEDLQLDGPAWSTPRWFAAEAHDSARHADPRTTRRYDRAATATAAASTATPRTASPRSPTRADW